MADTNMTWRLIVDDRHRHESDLVTLCFRPHARRVRPARENVSAERGIAHSGHGRLGNRDLGGECRPNERRVDLEVSTSHDTCACSGFADLNEADPLPVASCRSRAASPSISPDGTAPGKLRQSTPPPRGSDRSTLLDTFPAVNDSTAACPTSTGNVVYNFRDHAAPDDAAILRGPRPAAKPHLRGP